MSLFIQLTLKYALKVSDLFLVASLELVIHLSVSTGISHCPRNVSYTPAAVRGRAREFPEVIDNFRISDEWPRLSPVEQQVAEEAVIQDLVNKQEPKSDPMSENGEPRMREVKSKRMK